MLTQMTTGLIGLGNLLINTRRAPLVLPIIIMLLVSCGSTKNNKATEDPQKNNQIVESAAKMSSNNQELSFLDTSSNLIVYIDTDVQPTYKGFPWEQGLMIDFNKKFRSNYSEAIPYSRIVVQFVITSEGMLIAPRIIKSRNKDVVNNKVLQTISGCNTGWVPGKVEGRHVNTLLTFPIVW